ncbi:unnamed protein product, partial [Durusdinium trenchii]
AAANEAIVPASEYTDKAGMARVQGGCDLKSSQHYPPMFGLAIAEKWIENKGHIQRQVAEHKTLGV